MKRMLAMVLLAVLALCFVPAHAETAAEKMLNEWCAYLDECETQFALKAWTYQHAKRFCETRAWEDLLKARAAGAHALLAMQNRQPLTSALTDDEILELMLMDVEADVLLTEIDNTATLIEQNTVSIDAVYDTLVTGVFLTDDCELLGKRVEMNLKRDSLIKGYLRVTGNYLMEQLKDEVDIASYRDGFAERWPGIAEYEHEWLTDEKELVDQADEILKEYNLQEAEAKGYVGEMEYTMFMIEEAIQNGASAEFEAQLFDMPGEPAQFPMAIWMAPEFSKTYYLSMDPATGDSKLIAPLSEMEAVPDVMMLTCDDVKEAEAVDYIMLLDLCGIEHFEAFGETEEEDDLTSLIRIGEYTALFTWNDGAADFYFTNPIGSLVPPLYMKFAE